MARKKEEKNELTLMNRNDVRLRLDMNLIKNAKIEQQGTMGGKDLLIYFNDDMEKEPTLRINFPKKCSKHDTDLIIWERDVDVKNIRSMKPYYICEEEADNIAYNINRIIKKRGK